MLTGGLDIFEDGAEERGKAGEGKECNSPLEPPESTRPC